MKVISAKDETVRLFKSNFLEFFTRVHWSVPLILYVPVVLYMLFLTWQETSISLGYKVLSIGGGLFAWTLLEYFMHRFVFHFPAKGKISQKIFYLFHGIHHAYPSDSLRLVMPPAVSIPLAVFFYFLLSFILPELVFPPAFAGLVVGYLCYDMIHYATHHLPMKGRATSYLKRYHLLHHFKESDKGYGVSSPIWDFVFSTRYSERK